MISKKMDRIKMIFCLFGNFPSWYLHWHSALHSPWIFESAAVWLLAIGRFESSLLNMHCLLHTVPPTRLGPGWSFPRMNEPDLTWEWPRCWRNDPFPPYALSVQGKRNKNIAVKYLFLNRFTLLFCKEWHTDIAVKSLFIKHLYVGPFHIEAQTYCSAPQFLEAFNISPLFHSWAEPNVDS